MAPMPICRGAAIIDKWGWVFADLNRVGGEFLAIVGRMQRRIMINHSIKAAAVYKAVAMCVAHWGLPMQ